MALLDTMSLIFLIVPSFSLLFAYELPNNETFSQWNRMLESRLSDLMDAVTQVDFAKSVYKSDSAISIEEVNGEEVLKSVLKKVTKLLQSKKTALKKLVNKAEEKFTNFQKSNKSLPGLEDLNFINMKVLKPKDEMSFNSNFRQRVSLDKSGVHIPLEIFDGSHKGKETFAIADDRKMFPKACLKDPEILNGLNWTAGLDEVFKENQKHDPTLKWQYFGSFFGFMRVYPAFRWPDHPSLPDLFDVRRRSWYIQGSVTPKDVIILIDRSGSVHGPTLDIIKITARALLNSLGENDYVNVAWFNNKVKWVIPCITTLVQATAQIRRLLGDAVERLTESNLTSYATALDFAFDAFRKFDENKKPWTGSNCHKIIMFLSDGGTEWPSDLVTKHCNESRNGRIKIFTFACGPHPIPTVVLKEMACATGGYFSPITALGSVRVKIQDYVKVLSRPLAYSEDEDMYHWHNFYRDIGGLGMVTTVTLPVFDKSHKSSNSTHLLGVMGVDVSVEELVNLFPKHQIGSFGYPFAINTNGFVLFHPRLHDHIVYIEDPPNIYLMDLEGVNEEMENMQNAMIDGLHGSLKNVTSIVPVGSGHGILVAMDYFYGSVESSIYRFGIAIPSKQVEVKVKISDISTPASLLSVIKETFLAPWKFCMDDETQGDLAVEELAEKILNNYTSCNENLVNHLLWDVTKVFAIQNKWNHSDFPGVWSRFLITSGGLTTVHSSALADEFQGQADPLKNNLFKRAMHAQGFVFSVSKGRHRMATVAKKITIENSYVASVIGAEIEQEMIQVIFEEITGSEEESCSSSEELHCYLLNDGGIITATNIKTSKMGNFIGVHDPELLENLISRNFISREYRYNYQSWCSKDAQPVQTMGGSRQMSIFRLIFEAITSFHWNFIYTTILYLMSSVSAWKKIENSESLVDFSNHSCVTRSAWYYHSGISSHSSVLDCETHTRSVRASFISNISLILVVAHPPCKESTYYRPLTLDPEEDCGASSGSHAVSTEPSALVADVIFFLVYINAVISY